MDRKILKRMLQGNVPLTVEVMLKLGTALEIKPEDLENIGLNVPKVNQEARIHPTPSVQTRHLLENQPEAIIKLGFQMGLSFTVLTQTDQLLVRNASSKSRESR